MTRREFAQRLEAAQEFEQKVIAELTRRGWLAEPFGQGQLSAEMRDIIRRVNTPVRWMPDIICAKRLTAVTSLRFVDAKAGETWRDTQKHDIEIAALEGAEKWEQMSGCPVHFVFSDGGVITPTVLRELAVPGQFRGRGSGTPFLLVTRQACQRFDAIYGPPDRWTEVA
jgi:hypothetical protein